MFAQWDIALFLIECHSSSHGFQDICRGLGTDPRKVWVGSPGARGGGATFTICVNMHVRKFSEKGAFFGVRLRSEIRVSFLAECPPPGGLRKGCDSSIMNFRDMGPFKNLPYTHVNIDFCLSDPPGSRGQTYEAIVLDIGCAELTALVSAIATSMTTATPL